MVAAINISASATDIRDNDYKYVHFAEIPDLLFDIKNDPSYTRVMLKYVKKLPSWRMENDERILTYMLAGSDGVAMKPRTYK